VVETGEPEVETGAPVDVELAENVVGSPVSLSRISSADA